MGDVGVERLTLLAWLASLDQQDWDRPSLCEGWRVRDVVGHLITSFMVSPPKMAFRVVRAGGLSSAMHAVALELGERDPNELMEILRNNASSTFRPPGSAGERTADRRCGARGGYPLGAYGRPR